MAKHKVKVSKVPIRQMKIHNKKEAKAYKKARGNIKVEEEQQIFHKNGKKMRTV